MLEGGAEREGREGEMRVERREVMERRREAEVESSLGGRSIEGNSGRPARRPGTRRSQRGVRERLRGTHLSRVVSSSTRPCVHLLRLESTRRYIQQFPPLDSSWPPSSSGRSLHRPSCDRSRRGTGRRGRRGLQCRWRRWVRTWLAERLDIGPVQRGR